MRNAWTGSSICLRIDPVSGSLRQKFGLFSVSRCKATIKRDGESDDGERKDEEEFLPASLLVSGPSLILPLNIVDKSKGSLVLENLFFSGG